MSFKIHKGKTVTRRLPVTASTVLSKDSLVVYSSGKLIAATSSTNAVDTVGIVDRAIVATDDDYADERLINVIVPVEKNVEVEADVTSGLVAADIGLYQDLTNSTTVDRSASSKDIAQCVKVISTTKGIFRLNIGGAGA